MTSPLDIECPTCHALAGRYCDYIFARLYPNKVCPARLNAAEAETVPTDPLELAHYTIAKYGADSSKPSAILARRVIELEQEIDDRNEEAREYE